MSQCCQSICEGIFLTCGHIFSLSKKFRLAENKNQMKIIKAVNSTASWEGKRNLRLSVSDSKWTEFETDLLFSTPCATTPINNSIKQRENATGGATVEKLFMDWLLATFIFRYTTSYATTGRGNADSLTLLFVPLSVWLGFLTCKVYACEENFLCEKKCKYPIHQDDRKPWDDKRGNWAQGTFGEGDEAIELINESAKVGWKQKSSNFEEVLTLQ